MLRIMSWNVNGLRSIAQKGFLDWLSNSKADIVCLQEIRVRPEQISDILINPFFYQSYFSSAIRPGYSGVALYTKIKPDQIETKLNSSRFDNEGRLQLAYFGRFCLANVYFPNGKGTLNDNSRIPFKLDFYKELFNLLETKILKGFRVIVIGDFNTAHTEIDLARPKENKNISGFCIEEREEISRWLLNGYLDTFRMFNKNPHQYTWWSQRAGARVRNVGWRIDYALVSNNAKEFVISSEIYPSITGSDHCPIDVCLDEKILI